jgi:hypothetical protein
MEGGEQHSGFFNRVSSSVFKMKPVQITSSSADPLQQPRQYEDARNDNNNNEDNNTEKSNEQYADCPRLPPEMCLEILSFLDARTLISCSSVSRMWHACCKDETLWKELYERNADGQVFVRVRNASWYVLLLSTTPPCTFHISNPTFACLKRSCGLLFFYLTFSFFHLTLFE